jgi:ribosomal-protein-alanine N-acetyltransferase
MENLLIEKFDPVEINKILEIERNSFEKKEIFSKEYLLGIFKAWPNGTLMAKVNGETVGYVIGKKNEESGLVVSIAVKKEWRRKGIGKELMEKLIENFKKERVKIIFLHVREENREAINFYQKLGFKIVELVENYYSNGENAYLMERSL